MNISTFFRHVLGAPLHNERWSWGAVHPETGEIFLRCWNDEIEQFNGQQYVQVEWLDWVDTKAGRNERRQHVEAIQSGVSGRLVVCYPDTKVKHIRKIDSFDRKWIHQLGSASIVKDGNILLPIIGKHEAPRLVK